MEQRTAVAECRSGATTFRMHVANEWEQGRVETLATKEPETVRWIAEQFGAGDTLFDIGANIGIYAILAAAQNPAGTVVAVEPMPWSFARLCENAALNGLGNLRPYCVAVGAEDGLGELRLASLDAASSMHSLGSFGPFDEPVVMRIGTAVATIDSLAAAAGIPTLMKIDVDGGEDDVLAGAAAVLRDPRLRSVLIEFNWLAGAPQPRRDTPLLHAGFELAELGTEYDRGAVRWQNAIYRRR
ncbi:MAG TPA: FkbM family methyltransferase [Thermoanaerobaculia bacterium]|nr:FkbM family methyltransferase [Thermoanaerobaculia bacterium]